MKKRMVSTKDDAIAAKSSQRPHHHDGYLQQLDKNADKMETLQKQPSAAATAQSAIYREVLRPIDVNVCTNNKQCD